MNPVARIVTILALSGCGKPATPPVAVVAVAPTPDAASPEDASRAELAALCDAARLDPQTSLTALRVAGRCEGPAADRAAALALLYPSGPDRRAPTDFGLCPSRGKYLAIARWPDREGPDDFADDTTSSGMITELTRSPIGHPVTQVGMTAGPFADFDGDGVPELATFKLVGITDFETETYAVTVWFDEGAHPVTLTHTASPPARLGFVMSGGRAVVMFSPTGFDDDGFAPSDLDVFGVSRAGARPLPDAAVELWQRGAARRRLVWARHACAVDTANTHGKDAAWWIAHLVALGATPGRAAALAPALQTPEPVPVVDDAMDRTKHVARAIRKRSPCAPPAAEVRATFERERDAALVKLTDERATELAGHARYQWGCTTHGETLVALDYGTRLLGGRGSELWSIRAGAAPTRVLSALDPLPFHDPTGMSTQWYTLRIAGYGDFDGDGQTEALIELIHDYDRSHRSFEHFGIRDHDAIHPLEIQGLGPNGVATDSLRLEIVDGETATAPAMLARLDELDDGCWLAPPSEACDPREHPPVLFHVSLAGTLRAATKRELAAFAKRIPPPRSP